MSALDQAVTLEAGLDALDSRPDARPAWRARSRAGVLPPLVAFVALLAVWAAIAASGIKPAALLPSPSDVWHTLAAAWRDGTLQSATSASVTRAATGFALSVVVGTALGLLLSQVRWLRSAVGPLVSGLQSLPSATWLPAAVLWFGTGDAAVYVVVICGAVPSIALGVVSGVDRVPPLFLRVGQVLGASRLESLRHVVLPAALPGYVAGLRLGWAFAWRSLMAAELIVAVAGAGSSLGQLLDIGRRRADLSLVLAVIVVVLAIGIAVEVGFFAPLERRLLRDRGLAP
jgi:NitT/TauT family transport system permease protein